MGYIDQELRLARSIVRELNQGQEYQVWFSHTLGKEALHEKIQEHLSEHNDDDSRPILTYPELKKSASKRLLPAGDFAWLKDDAEACYWVWGRLWLDSMSIRTNQEQYYAASPFLGELAKYELPYPDMGNPILRIPSNAHIRLEHIVYFFDELHADLGKLTQLMESLKKGVGECRHNRKHPIKWLKPKDKEQLRWVWGQLIKKVGRADWLEAGEPPLGTPFEQNLLDGELFYSIITTLDLWSATGLRKKDFCRTLSRGWSTEKYRRKVKGQKVLNTYISAEAKCKLDELVSQTGMSQKAVLERLILKGGCVNEADEVQQVAQIAPNASSSYEVIDDLDLNEPTLEEEWPLTETLPPINELHYSSGEL